MNLSFRIGLSKPKMNSKLILFAALVAIAMARDIHLIKSQSGINHLFCMGSKIPFMSLFIPPFKNTLTYDTLIQEKFNNY